MMPKKKTVHGTNIGKCASAFPIFLSKQLNPTLVCDDSERQNINSVVSVFSFTWDDIERMSPCTKHKEDRCYVGGAFHIHSPSFPPIHQDKKETET